MSRKNNTKAEEVSGIELVEFLRSNGSKVNLIDRETNDKPDLLISVDSELTGCECVQIPPTQIFKFVKSRFKQLEKSDSAAVRVIWPQEPHFWVKKAIESKTKKINAYKRKSRATKIWLLIHAPVSEKDSTLRYENNDIIELMKHAAKKTNHFFDRIFFWGPKVGIKNLYPVASVLEKLDFDFRKGYPTDGFVMTKAKFSTTKEGAPPKIYDFGLVTPDEIIVPPLDPAFKKHKPNYIKRKYHLQLTVEGLVTKCIFKPVDVN